MTTYIPDPLQPIEVWLKADSSVASLVVARVFGFELPEKQADDMPRKCVVLSLAGGASLGPSARSGIDFGIVRVDAKTYGETPNEALKVELAVRSAMKAIRRYGVDNEGGLFWATVEGGPTGPLRDPDPALNWPYFLTTYMVRVAEVRNA